MTAEILWLSIMTNAQEDDDEEECKKKKKKLKLADEMDRTFNRAGHSIWMSL